MAGGGFGRWFVDVGLPGAQRNAFGQLDAGAVGRGIGFSALNQLAPGLGNFFARRYDQSHGAWDNSAGYLTDLTGNYGRATPDQLQGGTFQPDYGSYYQPPSFGNPNTGIMPPSAYGDPGMGGVTTLDPATLSQGIGLKNTIPDINRNIPAVNVGPSAPQWQGGNSSGALGGWGTSSGPSYGGTSTMYGFNTNYGAGNHNNGLDMNAPRYNQR